MIEIFCPNCDTLILDSPTCSNCGWQRVTLSGKVGTEVWTADLGTKLNKPHCYPAVAGPYYCLGTEDGTLITLDVESGEIDWECALPSGMMAHAVATDGARFFVGGEDISPIPSSGKALLALDAATGEERWRCPTEAHSLSAAVVHRGVVYFTATDGLLRAVDAETGMERWRADHAGWGPAPPVVGGSVVVAGGRDNTLYAYGAADGRPRWHFEAANWFANPLMVAGSRLFALAWDGHLYVIDLHGGELQWERVGERRRGFTTPPAAGKDAVYLGSRVYCQEDGERASGYALIALDAATGEERWRHYTEKHIFTPPLVAEDQVYFGANHGMLYALDADSGDVTWCLSATSRAVTRPQPAGDLVIFGGRDGMLHAVQWRTPVVEVLSPEAYLARREWVEAAAAYALRGDMGKAAELYEHKIDDWRRAVQLYRKAGRPEPAARLLAANEARREAAQLYEKAGRYTQAAALWEALGERRRARDLYEKGGDRRAYARVLEAMGDYLDAARVMEAIEDYAEAARLFRLGGDRLREADIYYQHLNQIQKTLAIWRDLDAWEREAKYFIHRGKKSEAARVLREHRALDRAANLFEEDGQLVEALELQIELEDWEKVALLAEKVDDYLQAAKAWDRLGDKARAAEAYVEAAKRETVATTPDEARLAEFYEHAAVLYEDLYEDERALACRHMVRRYRRLPHVEVQVKASGGFIEYQYNTLHLTAHNRGFGIARDIQVQFAGEFDVEGDSYLRSLSPERSTDLVMSVRPHRDQYGPSVPLRITVTYRDREGIQYNHEEMVRIAVNPERSLERLFGTSTPLNISIGELYQPGARRIDGDSFEGGSIRAEGDVLGGNAQKGDQANIIRGTRTAGAGTTARDASTYAEGDVLSGDVQKGDRVEIHREMGPSRSRMDGVATSSREDAGPKVTRRDAGPVRRCPICNVPTTDPEQRYCTDCGAPLPSPNVKEDV